MSQYPSPYSLPPAGAGPGYPYGTASGDALAPARRASVLMIVLGVLMLVYGLCNGVATYITPADQLQAQMHMFSKEAPPLPVEKMRVLTVVFSSVVVILGIFLVVNGIFVRRGRSGPITAALVVVIGVGVILGALTLIAVLIGFAMPVAFIGACFLAIPTSLFILLLVWLMQAAKNAGKIGNMQQQYMAQYAQYQQMMQQYGQAGYGQVGYGQPGAPPTGYGYAPPPAPQNPAPPPPTDQSNPLL